MKDSYCFKKSEWFFEESTDVPFDDSSVSIGMQLRKTFYKGKSSFQKVEFFDTYAYGRILVLDGVLQTAQKTEFVYHEMLCQVPMFSHPNPKNILIIGGGDGGSLREVVKHNIEKAVMVEIDKKVVDLSKKYLPMISDGAFDNKKSELIIGDGKEVIKKSKNYFDVIILDLSDPEGPAKELINIGFYKDVKDALRKDGIISVQSASFTCQPRLVKTVYSRIKQVFPYAEIRKAVVPEYQAGEYSFTVGSKHNLKKITINNLEKKFKKLNLGLKYLSPQIYFSSKILPKYLEDIVKT